MMSLARGIDISGYQPVIAWQKIIQATGISFVLVKASEAGGQDRLFAQHWAEAKSAGLLRGGYHFLRQSTDAHQQVQAYLRALGNDPGELPPILDIEDVKMTDAASYAAAAQLWLHEVESQLHRWPIIYTGAWWWNPNMLIGGQYPDWAGGYRLWVASYPLRNDVPAVAQIEQGQLTPILPKGWTSWMFWQYSGDVATQDGITDELGRLVHVDLNVFNGTVDELNALAQTAAPVAVAHSDAAATAGTAATTALASPASPAAGGLRLPDQRVTNQILINAFSHAFGPDYWQVVLRAGLANIANQRDAQYSGPAIQALASLTDVERTLLLQKLTQIVTGG
jgi:GH25 family lysozyme M1 (1,4-beta-N-acetylmuramidase)